MKMLQVLVWVAIMIFTTLVSAEEAKIAKSEYGETDGFHTEEHAAYTALKKAFPLTLDTGWEWGGWIFKYGDYYYYTEPATSERSDTTNIQAYAPKGAKWVANYHTHVPREQFDIDTVISTKDKRQARRHGVTAYMGVARTGEVKYYSASPMTLDRERTGVVKVGSD